MENGENQANGRKKTEKCPSASLVMGWLWSRGEVATIHLVVQLLTQ
jgi:hypothetical protein